jgi:hypothetical protein
VQVGPWISLAMESAGVVSAGKVVSIFEETSDFFKN